MSGVDKLFGGSSMDKVLLQNQSFPCSSAALESLWCPNSSTAYHGSKSVVTFGNINGVSSNVDGANFQSADNDDNHEEDYDRYLQQPGKKRRLTIGQVEFLEKNFEIENKLEPERKVQLAKELGLEPRQVAIWFQNRRARFKTKQLEKDYNVLKANYDKLKADYDILHEENDKLKNEVLDLKDKLIITELGNTIQSSINCERINSTSPESENAKLSAAPKVMPCVSIMASKQEEACSAKSDVVDSDSPHYTDGNHFSIVAEPAASSNVFETEHSEFSPNDEDVRLSKSLLPPIGCPRLGDESCNLGFPVEDILAFIN